MNSVQVRLFTGLDHVCVVTRDLERSIRLWWERYGVGPWSVYTKDGSNMAAIVDGVPTDFAMRVALCRLSPTFRIELIQPLDDRSPYAAALAEHGGADHIHHVRLEVEDFDAAGSHLGRSGLRRILDAEFAGASGTSSMFVGTYFDTRDDLGFVVEIGRAPPGFTMPEPELVYPQAAGREDTAEGGR